MAWEKRCKLRRFSSEFCVGGSFGMWLAFSGGCWFVVLPFTLLFFLLIFSFSLGFVLFGAVVLLVHMLNVPLRCGTRCGLFVLGKIFQAEGTNQITIIVILCRSTLGRPITPSHVLRTDSVALMIFGSRSNHVFRRREVFTCEKLN